MSETAQPTEPGAYPGDSYFANGGTKATHRWDAEGQRWIELAAVVEAILKQTPKTRVLLFAPDAELRQADDGSFYIVKSGAGERTSEYLSTPRGAWASAAIEMGLL